MPHIHDRQTIFLLLIPPCSVWCFLGRMREWVFQNGEYPYPIEETFRIRRYLLGEYPGHTNQSKYRLCLHHDHRHKWTSSYWTNRWHMRISANQETTTGNRDYILSGSLSNIQFEANGEERSVEIPLEVSERGRLLISEIYFSGCLWPDGKNVYNKINTSRWSITPMTWFS